MKKLMVAAALFTAAAMLSGCFTRALAYTKTTAKDGSIIESRVSIVGTGDKASQVAAEGLFADGAPEDLGAGVKTASASQQSTGVKETLEGVGSLTGPIARLAAASQGVALPAGAVEIAPAAADASAEIAYSSDVYDGVAGAAGEGVYGKPSCSRCRAYKAAHPDVKIIDIAVPANKSAMWAALKVLGFEGSSVQLPVAVTATGYTQAAK